MGTETASCREVTCRLWAGFTLIVLDARRMGKAIGEDKVILGQQTTVTTKSREEKMFPSSVEYGAKQPRP